MASKVHRIRFYNPKPSPINCVSFNKKLKLIAAARIDGSIEVWDLNKAPYMTRFVPGVENSSIEALCWVGDRLLSTGLNGALLEWDLAKLTQKNSVLLTGYAAWCMAVDNDESLVAIGTEQGYINLYSVENNDIVYDKLFDKQDGRIMCCEFDKTGNILVTGSIDIIRVWNVETGHAITKISVTRRQKEVIVWSIAVLSDNTIVSGDSQGRLTFWNAVVGEQIESYTIHKADILALVVSEDEKNIYCSGMDPTISHFKKIEGHGTQSSAQWVKHVQRHIHEHDVRGLVLHDGKLISAGLDGYLTFSSYPPKWVMRVPPMLPAPRSSVCAGKKLLLLRYRNHLEVWKLGAHATDNSGELIVSNFETENKSKSKKKSEKRLEQDSADQDVNHLAKKSEKRDLKIIVNPMKLVSVQTKKNKQIQCCALSPTGEFIAYATDSDFRMLKLETDDDDDEHISLTKVLIAGFSGTCDHVAFNEDSETMVVHSGSSLYVFHVDPEAGATVIQTIKGEKFLKVKSVLHLLVNKQSASGHKYIIVADTNGLIQVFVEKKKKFVPYVSLPKYTCVPTAMTIDNKRESLIIVYADQTILEYELERKKVCSWSGVLPAQWGARTSAVQSAHAHPGKDALVCQDATSLWVLDRNVQDNDNEEPVIKRKPDAPEPLGFNVIPVKYLADFHWLGVDEAVMLEVLPENIVSQLPPPVQLNRWS